jgi:hypothetical protein
MRSVTVNDLQHEHQSGNKEDVGNTDSLQANTVYVTKGLHTTLRDESQLDFVIFKYGRARAAQNLKTVGDYNFSCHCYCLKYPPCCFLRAPPTKRLRVNKKRRALQMFGLCEQLLQIVAKTWATLRLATTYF